MTHTRLVVSGALALALLAVFTQAGSAPASTATRQRSAATSPAPPLRLPARLPQRRVEVPILMYHRIHANPPADQRRLTVHPSDFAAQMRWLKRHGYRGITQRELFDALFRRRPLGRKPVLITFDDGYSDVFHHARPLLSKLGMPATAYVISGRTNNGDRVFLTWRRLRLLERAGIEIGSHSVTHTGLTSLSDRGALRELVSSRRAFERKLGHPVQWIAYPFGDYDSRIERLARRAGYVLGVTTEHGTIHSARRPLALPRLRILDSTGVRGLAALLRG